MTFKQERLISMGGAKLRVVKILKAASKVLSGDVCVAFF